MRSYPACLFVCVLFGALASVVGAQQEVVLKDGAVIKGRVTEDDGKKIVVQLSLDGEGSGTGNYTYDQLAPSTIYRLRLARIPRGDAKEQLALATYAFDSGLWDDARLSYVLAEAADKKAGGALKPQIDALVERAAPVAMQMAQKDVDAQRPMTAERRLSRILLYLPECPEAEKARAMLAEIQKKVADEREKKRLAEVAEEARERAKEILAPVKARYDVARALVRDALSAKNRQTYSIQTFRDAIANFEGVRGDLAQLMRDQGPKSDFAAHLPSWDKMVKNDIVDTYLHLASLYFGRSSLIDAQREVNAALAVDPKNSEALAMRGRLEVASSEGGKWKW
jgi:tetratricopeptide (TPR) repeat protein